MGKRQRPQESQIVTSQQNKRDRINSWHEAIGLLLDYANATRLWQQDSERHLRYFGKELANGFVDKEPFQDRRGKIFRQTSFNAGPAADVPQSSIRGLASTVDLPSLLHIASLNAEIADGFVRQLVTISKLGTDRSLGSGKQDTGRELPTFSNSDAVVTSLLAAWQSLDRNEHAMVQLVKGLAPFLQKHQRERLADKRTANAIFTQTPQQDIDQALQEAQRVHEELTAICEGEETFSRAGFNTAAEKLGRLLQAVTMAHSRPEVPSLKTRDLRQVRNERSLPQRPRDARLRFETAVGTPLFNIDGQKIGVRIELKFHDGIRPGAAARRMANSEQAKRLATTYRYSFEKIVRNALRGCGLEQHFVHEAMQTLMQQLQRRPNFNVRDIADGVPVLDKPHVKVILRGDKLTIGIQEEGKPFLFLADDTAEASSFPPLVLEIRGPLGVNAEATSLAASLAIAPSTIGSTR